MTKMISTTDTRVVTTYTTTTEMTKTETEINDEVLINNKTTATTTISIYIVLRKVPITSITDMTTTTETRT